MTIQTITASAPGKIHFLGEHTAVYFKPAILAAIDKRCRVELVPTKNPAVVISSKNFNKTITVSIQDILKITDNSQKQWEEYRESNDIAVLKGIVKDEMTYPIIAIGETLSHFKTEPKSGFQLTIFSEIPVGSGHGSSAAVAASVVGAVAKFLQPTLSFPRKRETSQIKNSLLTGSPIRSGMTDLDLIGKIAIRVEQRKHGNPSYGDVGAVVNGGLIWFQKELPEVITVKPLDFQVPKKFSENLVVIQSGVPEESTGEMVHNVAAFKKQNPNVVDKVLQDQERLTHKLLEAIKTADEEALLTIIREGEKNLETIGVVSPSAKRLIREIEKIGGAAKICGAGGKTKGSGIILAYHKNKKEIESIAKRKQLPYYTVVLGGKGLQIA